MATKEKQKRQQDLFIQMTKILESSLNKAVKDALFNEMAFIKHAYSLCYAVEDNPYVQLQLAQLDNRLLLLDLEQYKQVIKATNEAVYKEAKKAAREAAEDAIDELISDLEY